MPTGSNALGSDVLAGRGAIQTLSREATGLRGLDFLGMLTTNSARINSPACVLSEFIRCVDRYQGFQNPGICKILIFWCRQSETFAELIRLMHADQLHRPFFVRDISWSLEVMRLSQAPAAHPTSFCHGTRRHSITRMRDSHHSAAHSKKLL